ncbi:MAG: T9SS type A sorting domain-containing protein [Candidatus Zixiibacteriota bacterium]|nr:MAG: T9SS type A sorting domain-containing protein [candidate division Zixibacteria bacterium]
MRNLIFISVLLIFFLISSICLGQSAWNVEIIGKAAHDGPLYNYTANGDFFYIITNKVNPNRYLLSVVDISNPSHPHRQREIGEGEIGYGMLIVDNMLYITSAGKDSIIIFSLSNPSNPQELNRAAIADYILQLERLKDNLMGSPQVYAYNIINIEDRLNPGLLMTLDLQYFASNGILIGDYLYITGASFPGYHRYLEVFDISDTLNPYSIYLGDLGYGYYPRMRKIDNYIYITNFTAGIDVYDVSNPTNPVLIDTVLIDYPISDMLITGAYAFTSGYSDSIWTIDVSNPINPVMVHSFYNQSGAGGFYLDNGNLYFTTASVISMLDINNPVMPQLLGRYIPGVGAVDIAIWGNYAYLASGYGGFDIFDISDPLDPVGIGYYDTDHQTQKIHINDGVLYLADGYGGVLLFSLMDPINPELLSSIFLDANAHDIHTSDSLLYIADMDGFKIANISDPANPVIICNYPTLPYRNGCWNIIAYGDYVYTAELDSGICIYDVADIFNPFKIDCLTSGGWSEFAIKDSILLASRYDSGFSIFDICNPSNPTLISTTSPSATAVSEWGDLAYLTYSSDGVKVFDITNINYPESVGTYVDYGFCNGVVAENDTAYVSAGNGGLWVLRYQAPTKIYDNRHIIPVLLSFTNYPNPFNAKTTIRYSLPNKSEMTLAIYNLLAQQVETVFDGVQNPGEHTLTWDASHLPSGIYFARLETADRTENIKMVLLK